MPFPQYIVVTPTKDEERTIGETIESMVRQTICPVRWVIVSDGSIDGTDMIVTEAAQDHPWIQLVQRPTRKERSFKAVVEATEIGIAEVAGLDYQFVGLLDSDVRFERDYFEEVLKRFAKRPRLGLGGGMAVDVGLPRDKLPRNRMDVPGAVQFFTRECFESLGGLLAIPEGGWDTLTCVQARANGFETELFVDLVVDHLKPRNSGEGGVLRRTWQLGVRDYALGYQPLVEAFKCFDRLFERPILVGSMARAIGFGTSWLQRRPRAIPQDLLRFIRAEHSARLRKALGIPKKPSVAPVAQIR